MGSRLRTLRAMGENLINQPTFLSWKSPYCLICRFFIFLSYTDYNLKQNYTHYNVNSKIRSFSTDLSFFSRKNFIPFCVAAKDCLKTICRISGKHFTDVI